MLPGANYKQAISITLKLKQNSQQWFEYKMQSSRISASTLGTVIGVNKFTSRNKILEEYVLKNKGQYQEVRQKHVQNSNCLSQEASSSGILNEPIALVNAYRMLSGFTDFDGKTLMPMKAGIMLHPELPLSCSPDSLFYVLGPGETLTSGSRMEGLEVKVPFCEKNFPSSKEDINPCYIIQCLVCMNCFSLDRWFLFYLDIRNSDFKLFVVENKNNVWVYLSTKAKDFLHRVENDNRYSNMSKKEKKWITDLLLSCVSDISNDVLQRLAYNGVHPSKKQFSD